MYVLAFVCGLLPLFPHIWGVHLYTGPGEGIGQSFNEFFKDCWFINAISCCGDISLKLSDVFVNMSSLHAEFGKFMTSFGLGHSVDPPQKSTLPRGRSRVKNSSPWSKTQTMMSRTMSSKTSL